jgi:small-conductance mechanosensitive channel
VEIDGIMGEVQRIGIRSCTILTYQGAEAIIPNAALMVNRVINWTLSDRQCRGELPISVAYGVEFPTVMRILKQAAAAHPAVLPEPEPTVVFTDFGDGGLQFELQFWLLKDEKFDETRSAVAASVSEELRAEGIEIGVIHVGKNLVILKDK